MGYRLSHDELEQQLAEQVAIMRRTALAFDEGHEYEAKQLAARIRLLVHDVGGSHSLLGQLGLKNRMRFEDSTLRLLDLPPGAIVLHSGITITQMRLGGPNAGVAFAAPLDKLPPERLGPPVEFAQWWEPVILTDQEGNEFSRRSLVLALANQDGGAHVDPELRPGYAALVKENSLGKNGAGPGQEPRPLLNIALASVRQIAHELLRTFERELPGSPVKAPVDSSRAA
jgi:hypothetical protein